MSNKYSQLLDSAKKYTTDAIKTSKRAIRKTETHPLQGN